MKITLSENEIYDETSEYEALGISEEKWYIPTIHLYFNDDLTFAWYINILYKFIQEIMNSKSLLLIPVPIYTLPKTFELSLW